MTTKIETYKGFKVPPIMEVEEETFRSFLMMQNYECAFSNCHVTCRECLFNPDDPKAVKAYREWYKEHESCKPKKGKRQ